MRSKRDKTALLAGLLTLAALVCLGVAVRLLGAGAGPEPRSASVLALSLGMFGGLVVFLLGTVALLVARRLATAAAARRFDDPAPPFEQIDIRQWGDELAAISDRLREDVVAVDARTELIARTLEVPASWRPESRYVLGADGRAGDPLADLKSTRDSLIDAAGRVDAIVQTIRETAADPVGKSESSAPQPPRPRRWWRR